MNIKILDGNPNFVYENGVIYSADKTSLYYYPKEITETEFEIPDGVKRIQSAAFLRNYNIEHITIPASAEFIGMAALQSKSIIELTFLNTENWYTNSNQLVSPDELVDPASFNNDNGICRNGIHKTGN